MPPPLSEFENSILTEGSQKASVIVYRSTEESWWHKTMFVDIQLDGHPFMQLKGGEYVQIHLSAGVHRIKVEYDRYSGDYQQPGDLRVFDMAPGEVFYMEIIPSHEGITWAWGFPLFPVPLPGARVELIFQSESDARKVLGKSVDKELLIHRRILH